MSTPTPRKPNTRYAWSKDISSVDYLHEQNVRSKFYWATFAPGENVAVKYWDNERGNGRYVMAYGEIRNVNQHYMSIATRKGIVSVDRTDLILSKNPTKIAKI